jgi:hypothetical protein
MSRQWIVWPGGRPLWVRSRLSAAMADVRFVPGTDIRGGSSEASRSGHGRNAGIPNIVMGVIRGAGRIPPLAY